MIFNDYFTNMAKDIGSDDCINVYDNVPSCAKKHDHDYESVKDKVVCNVNNVITWFESNNMMVNPDKFQ